jgi:hypothetical protein
MAVRGITAAEYEHLSSEAEKARIAANAARGRLDRHIAEHGC